MMNDPAFCKTKIHLVPWDLNIVLDYHIITFSDKAFPLFFNYDCSQGLNLPDSPFASSIASGISTVI